MIQFKNDDLISKRSLELTIYPDGFSLNTWNCFMPLCFVSFRQFMYFETLFLKGCEFTVYDHLIWQLRIESWMIEVPTSITLGVLTGSYDYPVIWKHTLHFCSIKKKNLSLLAAWSSMNNGRTAGHLWWEQDAASIF